MLGMNDNGDVVVGKQFIIRRKQTVEHYYTVEADSKVEAIRMVDDEEVWDYEEHYIGQTKAKFDSMLLTYQCSNKHNGWTSVASDVEVGSNRWHYNGMCKGVYQDEDAEMCHHCASALAKGHSPLTQDELQWLNDTYNVVIE